MAFDGAERVFAKGHRASLVLFRKAANEGMRQQRRVTLAIAQGRQTDHDFGQPVIKILAKPPFTDQCFEILMGRADDAYVDGYFLTTADPFDHSLLQETEKFRLQGHGKIADLVKHQGAAIGDFDFPRGRLYGTGKRTLLVTEQFAFEKGVWNGRAVDGDEALSLSGRCGMYAARD
ncbi:hypothetical protein SDC9_202503 [bioreactor metagenome]|uniref:Uncharacterized protein n=1 Tax=bioreactor metagenome TaxID=1076179 RepID=A0A645IUI7_9ZZZZ